MIIKYLVKSFLFTFIVLLLFSPSFVFGENVEDKPVLFYGDGCPHCANVESYLEDEGILDDINRKEIYQNRENAQEFNEICEEEGIEFMDRGVPFLYAEGECFIGDKQIVSYFEGKEALNKVIKPYGLKI